MKRRTLKKTSKYHQKILMTQQWHHKQQGPELHMWWQNRRSPWCETEIISINLKKSLSWKCYVKNKLHLVVDFRKNHHVIVNRWRQKLKSSTPFLIINWVSGQAQDGTDTGRQLGGILLENTQKLSCLTWKSNVIVCGTQDTWNTVRRLGKWQVTELAVQWN